MRGARTRVAGIVAGCWLAAAVPSQHGGPVPLPRSAPAPATKTAPRPTHAPRLELEPLLAWHHLRGGNEAFVAARAAGEPAPAPATRPSGTGRYVCAVLACADADLDVAELLGLRRRDVLLITTPGPFATTETVALLEQAVAGERLSLIVVLGHAECRTLATERGVTPSQDATARRVAAARGDAARRDLPLLPHLLRSQCQHLLAASDLLRAHVRDDTLRVLPAEVDARTGALLWHHERAEQYAVRPVR